MRSKAIIAVNKHNIILTTMKEIININIGEASIHIGDQTLALYRKQHGLGPSSAELSSCCPLNDVLFQESSKGTLSYRSISVDCDQYPINEKVKGPNRSFYNPDWCIGRPQATGGVFSSGKKLGDQGLTQHFIETFRKIHEACDKLEGVVINGATLGGTSGLLDCLMATLAGEQYIPKVSKIGYILYPSKFLSNSLVQIYNFTLSGNATLNHFDLVIPFDNQMLYRTAEKHQDIEYPGYREINQIIAQVQSSVSLSQRRTGKLNTSFRDMLTNLVCYPRIHYTYPSFVGLDGDLRATKLRNNYELTKAVLDPSSQLMDMRQIENKIAIALFYRGFVEPFEVSQSLSKIRQEKPINCVFEQWSPLGFKVAINDYSIPSHNNMRQFSNRLSPTSCCSLTNSLEMGFPLADFNHKFDSLYSRRVFIHYYVKYGLEEGQLTEAREDLAALEKDYEPCRCLQDFQDQQ